MTALDALAAALRERIVDGRPAPLPGVGTLVRQHVSARVEEQADGSRVLLPPGETVGLAGPGEAGGSITESFGRYRGLPVAEAQAGLGEAMDQVEALLVATGEARLSGVGVLRRTPGGVAMAVDADLLETINRPYDALGPIAARSPAPPEPEGSAPDADDRPAPEAASEDEEPEADPTGPDDEGGAAPDDAPAVLSVADILPHPGDGARPAPPDDVPGWNSLAPSGPSDVDAGGTGPEDAGPGGEVDDARLAVPFGAPAGEALADVLPPTPPDRDPSAEAAEPTDDEAEGGAETELGGFDDASAPDASSEDGATSPTDADEDGADAEPEGEWLSSRWAPPPSFAPVSPTPPDPAERDVDVADVEHGDGAGGAALDADPVDAEAEAPETTAPDAEPAGLEPDREALAGDEDVEDEDSPFSSETSDRGAEPEGGVAASEAEAPSAYDDPDADPPQIDAPDFEGDSGAGSLESDAALPPAVAALDSEPAVEERRGVPVERVGPPIGASGVADEPALRDPAAPALQAPETTPAPSVTESRGVPWWLVGALAVLAVVAVAWWALTRGPAETDVPAPQAAAVETGVPAEPAPQAAPPPAEDAPAVLDDVPSDAAVDEAAPDAGGAGGPVPPRLADLGASDRATLAGGAVDADDRDTWTFVVASLRSPAEAEAVRARYAEAGYKAAVVAPDGGAGRHRVAVGQFRSRSQALALRDRLPTDAPPDTWLSSLRDL